MLVGSYEEYALCCYVRFWWGEWFSVSHSTVHEQFKDLLPMLNCLTIGTAVDCWHHDTIGPFWQCHQIGLIFF